MSLHQPPEFLPTPGKPAIPWTQWHRVFKNYLLASGSDAHTPARRKALLLHCLGVEGQRVYYALPEQKPSTPPAAEKEESSTSDEYEAAVAALDAYFTAKTNVVVERHQFGQRTQLPGETAAAFVTALRELSSSCAFGEQVDNFIRDQLVAKTCNHVLRERLLLEGTSLTLERPAASTGQKLADFDMACIEDVACRGNSVLPDCRFAITAIDYFSKWTEVCFSAKVTAATVISFLRSILSREGYPDEIVTDHGPQFTASEFDGFLKERGITHAYSAVYHPQAYGQVERFNRAQDDFLIPQPLPRVDGEELGEVYTAR
ncbi:uncharacterized protein LOC144163749 [Haemaphysalis longicornis]